MKKLLLSILAALCCASAFSITNVADAQPDFSGDYVYYQDKTFKNADVYIGFLYYNDSTYGVRYFSRKKGEPVPNKDITVLFSLDPSAEHLELTGERIVTKIEQEDTDTINYIHDMLYELYGRRQKVAAVIGCHPFNSAANAEYQDYPQFGGTVVIRFNKIIPIFNIYSIEGPDGESRLQAVTIGALTSSEDKSFAEFYGSKVEPAKKPVVVKKQKGKTEYSCAFDKNPKLSQKISLDANWVRQSENVFVLNSSNGLTMTFHPFDAKMRSPITDAFLRTALQGKNGAYTDLESVTLREKDGTFRIEAIQHLPNVGISYKRVCVLRPAAENVFACMNFHCERGFYEKNSAYFKEILNSYNIEKT